MKLFFELFHTGIPFSVYVISLILGVTCSVFLMLTKSFSNRLLLLIWLSLVLFLMLYTTVIGREPKPYCNYHLIPFWSIQAIRDGYIETLYEKIYNVLFFVPYGLLLGLYFKKHPVRYSFFVGCITSIGIELLQFITRTGTCETDDVICNTLGCGIGLIIAIGCMKLFKRVKIDNND